MVTYVDKMAMVIEVVTPVSADTFVLGRDWNLEGLGYGTRVKATQQVRK